MKYQKNKTDWIFIWLPCNAKCKFCNTEHGFWRKFAFIDLRIENKDFKTLEQVIKEQNLHKKNWYEIIVYESNNFIDFWEIEEVIKNGQNLWLKQRFYIYLLDQKNKDYLDWFYHRYSVSNIDFPRWAHEKLRERFNFDFTKFIPFDKLKTKLDEAKSGGVECIVYEWWDFSVYPKMLEALEYWQRLWIKQTFQTNGMILSDINIVKKIKNFWVEDINFSLHAYDSVLSDSIMWVKWWFEKTIKAIKNCVEQKMTVSQNMVITKDNVNQIENIIVLALKLKIDLISFILFIPPEDKLRENDNNYIESLLPDPVIVWQELSKMLKLLKAIEIKSWRKNLINIKFHNIPLCLLDKQLLWDREYIFDVFRKQWSWSYSKWAWFYKNNDCENCKLNESCTGITEYYINSVWVDFLNKF